MQTHAPKEHRRKILYLHVNNLAVCSAQHQSERWNTHPCIVADRIVRAASPAAQRLGIEQGMQRSQALRIAPRVECIGPATDISADLGGQLEAILLEYTDLVEAKSPCEYFLDITYNKMDIPIGLRAAQLLRGDLSRELALDTTMALAPNKLLAQMVHKTGDGRPIYVLERDEVEAFLADKPIDLLPGVGAKIRHRLHALRIEHIGQLAQADLSELQAHCGHLASKLHRGARGIDHAPVAPHVDAAFLSADIHLPVPLYDMREICAALRAPVEDLVGRLRRRPMRSRHISVQIWPNNGRTDAFERELSHDSNRAEALLEAIAQCVEQAPARAAGMRGCRIEIHPHSDKASRQLDLFTSANAP